ncbi:MAG: class I SAM-dependent rRNA methyltransferase [Spirochaetota bacterium]
MRPEKQIKLLKGRDKPVRFGHPWVFSGAIQPATASAGPVTVLSHNSEVLGEAFYNPGCRLALRMLSKGGAPPFTHHEIVLRLQSAIKRRSHLLDQGTDAIRLVFAESDFLPGLIVDKFGDCLSVQFNSAFAEHFRPDIVAALGSLLQPKLLIDTSDNQARNREQLPPVSATAGTAMEIQSRGVQYRVAPGGGQKTGFYLDQAMNREIVASHASGLRVLDAFSYSGGFSIACLKAGATSVTAIDSSAEALQLLQQNLELNRPKLSTDSQIRAIQADVFEELRRLKSAEEKFDLIILDPPKLAASRGKVDAAEKAYKDLNLQALHLAAPGALLATFSCSGAMTFEKLRQVLHYAAHDAGKEVQILQLLTQAEDHPILLAFPESEYLRGYLCRVL